VLPAAAQDPGPGTAGQEETIDISKEAIARIRLLLETFSPLPGATAEETAAVQGVVNGDLHNTDLFRITIVPALTDSASLAGGTAQALARGTVEIRGGNLILHGSLESLPDRARIFSRDYETKPEWYREAAHRFADDIVLFLTGEQGISRTRIVYTSNRSGNKEIFMVDYDGNGLTQVTRNGSINLTPTWNPDATRIAFVSYKNGNPDIYEIELATGKERLLVGGPGVQGAPAYSPDGKRLAYSQTNGKESEIYICAADGSGCRRLTHMGSINTSPSWSPDGRRISFTSDRSGSPQLYVVEVDGGTPRRLTFVGNWNDEPDWSPRGDRIIYTSRDMGSFRISLVDPGGMSEEGQRTYGEGQHVNPVWAPDGRHVVFGATRGGRSTLQVLDVDSGRLRPVLVEDGVVGEASWSPIPPR
jgi:TolB protein